MKFSLLFLLFGGVLILALFYTTDLYGDESLGRSIRGGTSENAGELKMAIADRGLKENTNIDQYITIMMTGDVMLGRGIDQILLHPSKPVLHESYMKDARGYVALAERVHGLIPYPVECSYIWGDALEIIEQVGPDLRLINLETSITVSDDYWPGKGINYRMHPANATCLQTARIDHCTLANNHVLDWGYKGLMETLKVLGNLEIKSSGAGRNSIEALAPAVFQVGEKGRVLVFSFGHGSSGVPSNWAAGMNKLGVNRLQDFSRTTVSAIREEIATVKLPGDIVVFSIHWGGNWGYSVPAEHSQFAHWLIDDAGVDVIFGHSSHHVKGIEIYNNKLILYGCGDFLNDYEGISGHEEFRGDLALIYFASIDPVSGHLGRLRMSPTRTQYFKANRASIDEISWLRDVLNREGCKLGTKVTLKEGTYLTLDLD